MSKFFYFLLFIFLFSVYSVYGEQTVKTVEYPIGFVASASANQDYVTSLNITSPDGIGKILSLEIILQGDFQTTTAVNGRINSSTGTLVNCTPSTWTTPSVTQGVPGYNVNFDCSSLIGTWKGGIKQAGFRVNKVATNIYATLKVTYYNNPKGGLIIHGTEYYPEDAGRIFLQLTDDQSLPVNNGVCYATIYYPATFNATHAPFVQSAPMVHSSNDINGLYYYDFAVPDFLGVYMVTANCYYQFAGAFVYSMEGTETFFPSRNITYGTYTGSPIFLNDFEDWIYTKCTSQAVGGSKYCTASYDFNTTIHFGNLSNITNINLFYMGESSTVMSGIFKVWNWTNSSWITLPNQVQFSGGAGTVPIGIGDFISNSIPLVNTISSNGIIRIQNEFTSGSTFSIYTNWLNIELLTAYGTIQDIRGSSEVHVNPLPPGVNKDFRVLTCDGNIDGRCAIFTNDEEFDLKEGELEDWINITATTTKSDAKITYSTPYSVDCTALYWIKEWNGTDWADFTDYVTTSDSSTENCVITLTKSTVTGTNYYYWIKLDNYMKWETEWTKQILDSINQSVYPLCSNRNFTYVNPITDTTNISNNSITNYCHQFYDDMYWAYLYYGDSQSVTVAGEFVSYIHEMRLYRQMSADRFAFLILGNNTNLMSDYYSNKVWNYNTRNLTYYQDVTNYTKIQQDVWTNSIRNLTYYPTQVDLTNYTKIQQDIWSNNNRTLTEFGFTINATATVNNTAVAQAVWNYDGTILTSILTQIADTVWQYMGGKAEII